MSSYSIGSESPRWWWLPAAAGAVGSAAIAAILVLPATGTTPPGGTTPEAPPAPASDPWFSTFEPAVGRQCYALQAGHNASLTHLDPRCGHGASGRRPSDVRRPGLDSRP